MFINVGTGIKAKKLSLNARNRNDKIVNNKICDRAKICIVSRIFPNRDTLIFSAPNNSQKYF